MKEEAILYSINCSLIEDQLTLTKEQSEEYDIKLPKDTKIMFLKSNCEVVFKDKQSISTDDLGKFYFELLKFMESKGFVI